MTPFPPENIGFEHSMDGHNAAHQTGGNSGFLDCEEGSDGNTAGETVTSIAKSEEQQQEAPQSKCPRPLVCILVLLTVAVIIPLLFVFDIISNEDLEGVPVLGDIDFDNFFDTDPYGGEVSPLVCIIQLCIIRLFFDRSNVLFYY